MRARERFLFALVLPVMSIGSKLEEALERIVNAFTDLITVPLSEFAKAFGDWFSRSLTSWYSLILVAVAVVVSFVIWKLGRNVARLLR